MQFIEKDKDSIVIGIPSKGRLKEHVYSYLKTKGYKIMDYQDRTLQTTLNDKRIKVCFMHAKDIPTMLEKNLLDVGFTGMDLIYETQSKTIRPLIKTGLGKVRMAIAVPIESNINHPYDLMNKTIATSFENIAKEYFDGLNLNTKVHKIYGASEGMPYLGLCDGIMDVVETGNSIVANNLRIIVDNLYYSELVLAVNKPEFGGNYLLINEFLSNLY